MKLKIINIISIFIVIIIIGYVLIPWSKRNMEIENFAVSIYSSSSNPPTDKTISLFDYLLQNRQFSIDYENRIAELKKLVDNQDNKLLKYDDYKNLIDEVKEKIIKEYETKYNIGDYLLNQNEKDLVITDLTNQINLLNTRINTDITTNNDAQPVRSFNIKHKTIKSMKYGISLSVEELVNGIIMIHLNNGCLTYDKENPNKEYYSIKHCEMTNNKQHFIARKNFTNYVISPVNNLDLFLKVDNIGLSLEKYELPFNPYLSTPQPTNSNSSEVILNHPDDFIWAVLPIELNGCNKMEKRKITIKK